MRVRNTARPRYRNRNRGFSLVELVMVVMIIALVGAMAIPRLSRGSAGAAASALLADLEAMNKALDLYSAEHGGSFPDTSRVADQLTLFTDFTGDVSGATDSSHLFGPYLRTIPPLPLGGRKGAMGIAAADAKSVGWIYDANRGVISANSASGSVSVAPGGGAVELGGGGVTTSDGGGATIVDGK